MKHNVLYAYLSRCNIIPFPKLNDSQRQLMDPNWIIRRKGCVTDSQLLREDKHTIAGLFAMRRDNLPLACQYWGFHEFQLNIYYQRIRFLHDMQLLPTSDYRLFHWSFPNSVGSRFYAASIKQYRATQKSQPDLV